MDIIIRNTKPEEYKITEILTREVFWNLFKSGCDEHLVLHNLRKSPNYLPDFDLVACIDNDEIIGHIILTKAQITDLQNTYNEVLCVGPISVHPKYQNLGIGTKLISEAIQIAKKSRYKGLVLFGNPDYYKRFGFVNAKKYEITTKDGLNFEPFMVLELFENSLKDIRGKFFDDDAFNTNYDELEEFEKMFPKKEKSSPKIDLSKYI